MPETARLVDGLRRVFGAPQWLRFTENGRTVEHGRPVEYTRAVQASGRHGRKK